MKVKIEINCQEEKDINIHLSVLRQSIKAALKSKPDGAEEVEFEDENFLGGHKVSIEL